ncbi:porin [Burkholderia glumae]|uniref:porin n=1 Tax=Burkholderia glumae TaxID=337 RepID=UPI001294918A|nr:porin [Burkholderia glumae]MCM2551990.1 porin [Burkholderia glumae]NVE25041.1 porin [Burkholderia glumae]QGA41089.1 porin [Burkholderia glumae]
MMRSSTALLGLLGVAMGAHAQSSVTLYGLLDTSLVYTNNQKGAGNYQMSSGVESGSRWGLKGAENLGGGYAAIFQLENGFSGTAGTLGQNGRMFGRAAWVGAATPYGTLTLGRQNEPSADFLGPLVASNQFAGGIGAHPGDTDNLYVNSRISNSVKFSSRSYHGFRAGALFSFGGTAGDFNRNRIWSVAAGYDQGPLALGVSYIDTSRPNTALWDGTAGSAAISPNNSPIFSGYTSARAQRVASVAGNYRFGKARFGLAYSNSRFEDLGSGAAAAPVAAYRNATAVFDNAEVSFSYRFTPSVLLGVAYGYTNSHGAGNAHYHQLNIGGDYLFSKRTDVYLTAAYQHASGTDSTGKAAVAALWPITASSNSHQVVAALGLRHKF